MSNVIGWENASLREVVAAGRVLCSLEEAALVLARQEYAGLDAKPWLARIESFAALARPHLSERADAAEIVGVVSDVLFRDLQFQGNAENYYDPRNSFLNDVLHRRRGIPISLATVYMAVARRLGLELAGTGFPGHFLIVYPRADRPILIDAFDRGRALGVEQAQALAARMGYEWERRYIEPVAPLAILRRMLNNLKNIYAEQEDWPRLLRTSAQILVVSPEEVGEYFTQGVALAALEARPAAIAAFELYLTHRPHASNRDDVLDVLSELRATKPAG